MQSIALEFKIGRRGVRICSFPECKKRRDLITYFHYQLCHDHYDYVLMKKAGQEPPICSVPACCRVSNLVEHEGHLLCSTHYRKICRRTVYNVPGTCYINTCPGQATHEFKGKLFCSYHCEKIRQKTEAPIRYEDECNYVGCCQPWTVSGFNNRWCPQHYLEMCKIREEIKHDNSESDLVARLKELRVRKDGFTETGLRHRWYYLQSVLGSLSK